MANKTTANAFMASAQKSKREMADIQKEGSGIIWDLLPEQMLKLSAIQMPA